MNLIHCFIIFILYLIASVSKLPGLEKGRGDLLLPGIRIVLGIFDHFQKDLAKGKRFRSVLEGLLLDYGR